MERQTPLVLFLLIPLEDPKFGINQKARLWPRLRESNLGGLPTCLRALRSPQSQLKRLKELEEENRRLKTLVADLSLDKVALKSVIEKNGWSR